MPGGQDWWAILTGALLLLADPASFEQDGGLTPAQTADYFSQMFLFWDKEVCPLFPGMVVAAACSSVPNAHWLLCDGATYDASLYPALFSAIGVVFGDGGEGTFKIPDLRSRFAVGVGAGPSLTEREMADTGGEESHTLTTDEMPSHSHGVNYQVLPAQSGAGGGVFDAMYGAAISLPTQANGGGGAHNNMPPFLALNFFIYAG